MSDSNGKQLGMIPITFWLLLSVGVLGGGIYFATSVIGVNDGALNASVVQQLNDAGLSEKEFADVSQIISTNFAANKDDSTRASSLTTVSKDGHVVIIVTLAFVAGIWGGVVSYTMTFMESIVNEENDNAGTYNKNSIHASVLAGIVAALTVPLFLDLIGSNHLQVSYSEPLNYLIFLGFCLLASIFSRNFITKLADKAINRELDSIKQSQNQVTSALKASKSQNRDLDQRLVSASFEIAILKANEYYSFFKEKRRKFYEKNFNKSIENKYLSTKLNELPEAEKRALKENLLDAIIHIDKALGFQETLVAFGRKGNYLRQLYNITLDKTYLEEAKAAGQKAVDRIPKSSATDDQKAMAYWNLACYKSLTDEEPEQVLPLILEAIDLEDERKDRVAKEDDFNDDVKEAYKKARNDSGSQGERV